MDSRVHLCYSENKMKKETKHSLNIIRETPPPASPDPIETAEEALSKKTVEPQSGPEKKSSFSLPESYLMAQEMKDLFEEDIVTHVQGPAEPEAD